MRENETPSQTPTRLLSPPNPRRYIKNPEIISVISTEICFRMINKKATPYPILYLSRGFLPISSTVSTSDGEKERNTKKEEIKMFNKTTQAREQGQK